MQPGHLAFVEAAAELYELVAMESDSIKSMRDGLEMSDSSLLARFNHQVDVVNDARDAAAATLPSLGPLQQQSLRAMGLTPLDAQ